MLYFQVQLLELMFWKGPLHFPSLQNKRICPAVGSSPGSEAGTLVLTDYRGSEVDKCPHGHLCATQEEQEL